MGHLRLTILQPSPLILFKRREKICCVFFCSFHSNIGGGVFIIENLHPATTYTIVCKCVYESDNVLDTSTINEVILTQSSIFKIEKAVQFKKYITVRLNSNVDSVISCYLYEGPNQYESIVTNNIVTFQIDSVHRGNKVQCSASISNSGDFNRLYLLLVHLSTPIVDVSIDGINWWKVAILFMSLLLFVLIVLNCYIRR